MAALSGALLGATVVFGVETARMWGTLLGVPTGPPGPPVRPTGQVTPCLAGSTCMNPDGLPQEQRRLIALVTGERHRAGCKPVQLDARLEQAAQDHAQAIVTTGHPSHTDTQQRTPQDRAEAAGYHGRVRETLAAGVQVPEEVMDLWLDATVDPSLRPRINDCSAISIGVGHSPARANDAYGPGIWILLLGRPESR
ncbi:MAG TPA: CAP domain-containing protein [Kineosporiaceae bacterium]|nr:CAP domain-containing protein [Kineosporiaceae bacterium]